MNELTVSGDRRMTVREVAEILGCDPEAIKKHVRELFPSLMQNGVTTYLTEEQVTAIKQRMIPTTKVVGAITDLEAAGMLLKSAEHFKARFEQERDARIEAESKLAIAEPKAAFYGLCMGSSSVGRNIGAFAASSTKRVRPALLIGPPSLNKAVSKRTITSSLTLRR